MENGEKPPRSREQRHKSNYNMVIEGGTLLQHVRL